MMIDKNIALVGPNSIHTIRYLNAISTYFKHIIFITNNNYQLTLPANIEVHKINFKLTNLSAAKQLAILLNKYHCQIIHIHQANSYAYHTIKAYKRSKLVNCKIILTTWGSDILILPKKNLLFKKMVKFNLANSDIVTSDSLFMSAQIKQLLPNVKQLYTINFGIQNFPEHINLAEKEDIILSNRLHKKLYNIEKIITGFANLIKHYPRYLNYKLIIAGSGEDTEDLQRLAQQLQIPQNQITFTGMLSYPELIKWYKKAKLFISIPDSDATSLSLLEAISYGGLPILSNLPANLEWVLNEINGIICENPELIYNDMHQALEIINDKSKYHQLTQFNHELIKQKAVFENNINKFISLYT